MKSIIKLSMLRVRKNDVELKKEDFFEVEYKNGIYYLLNNFKGFDEARKSKDKEIAVNIVNEDIKSVAYNIEHRLKKEKLNPIEEALLYMELVQIMGISQNELANKLGHTQGNVSNKKRLLNLPLYIQKDIIEEKITERHGRAFLQLLKVEDSEEKMKLVYDDVKLKKLKVSETENVINKVLGKKIKSSKSEIVKLDNKRDVRNKIAIPAINQVEKDIKNIMSLMEEYYPQLSVEFNSGVKDKDYIVELKFKDIK